MGRPDERLSACLERLVSSFDRERHRASDPVRFVHRYVSPADREVVGLVAALLAFGRVRSVSQSVERVLERLGPSPAATIERSTRAQLTRRLRGCRHRMWGAAEFAQVLSAAARLRRREGSLGRAFAQRWSASGGDLREAIARWADALRGRRPTRTLRSLVPDPRSGSACKRLLLYLRWMVRPDDGIDLGLWPLPPSILLVPLDTHVHRMARNLGLTRRATASWRTAEEVTDALRRIDSQDPVRFDFALCHLGVSRACRSRFEPTTCLPCALRPVCKHARRASDMDLVATPRLSRRSDRRR
ncbi:MAG: TIGR02757 family protein [Myxococcota bacterium]|nr:TIGR02757 family protein [Myxococcota bacterium]